jgi:ABC-type dipeptide/oligopeptide/nickel transport system ATPase component
VLLDRQDLMGLSEEEMRKVRGNRVSMIFQQPMTSLNPVVTVGFQLGETLRLHQALSRKGARTRFIPTRARYCQPPHSRIPGQKSTGWSSRETSPARSICPKDASFIPAARSRPKCVE